MRQLKLYEVGDANNHKYMHTRVIILLIVTYSVCAVSYTHLDVYKRQWQGILSMITEETQICLLYTSRCV